MEKYEHFSHNHKLSFHKSLEGAQLTCTACNFPCTGTPIYSCRPCKFFLHEQCFEAKRSLIHPSHPNHPLSLFPSPTYTSRSFICNSCNKTGSGFCFCCSNCEFDLHIQCAYNDHNPKSGSGSSSSTTLNRIQLTSHPNHPLQYLPKQPYASNLCSCDVCGTDCDPNGPVYHCDICGYDVHIGCVNLPETVKREDHAHGLSLLHVNPNPVYECDVCRCAIDQKHSMYFCESGCDYGIHVKCVTATVSEKAPMNEMDFQVEMFKLQNQMRVHQMMIDTKLMGISGYNHNRYYRY